jgi:putative peptidoglycan lipid II flippase
MLVGAFAFAANTIVPRAYYATQDTLFPAIYGTVAVMLSIPLYLIGLNLMGSLGVALAASLSAIMQVLVLYTLWNRRNQNAQSRSVYFFYLKMIAFSVPLGVFLAWFKSTVLAPINTTTFAGSLMVCVASGLVFVLILLAAGYGMKIKEISQLAQRLSKKLRPVRG